MTTQRRIGLSLVAAAVLGACGERGPETSTLDVAAAVTPDGTAAEVGDTTTAADTATSAEAAVVVLRRYYAAIDARDYWHAYALWGSAGTASGQTFEAFAAGYARTARVELSIGRVGQVEGAVGSRYVEVPVVIRAEGANGEVQRFEGTYTLRRVVVEGASPAQRRWHIDSAHIVRTGGAPARIR